MRHLKHHRILGRTATTRAYLFKSLVSAMLKHGSIVTTQAKGKELRLYLEPLITRAKQGNSLANRRLLMSQLEHKKDIGLLFNVAKASANRPGGYLRITNLPSKRMDGAKMVRVDFVDAVKA